MANELDEITGSVDAGGRDVNVIAKQIPVTVGAGSRQFEIAIWVVGFIPGLIALLTGAMSPLAGTFLLLAGAAPGLIFGYMKVQALAYLRKLQQKIADVQRDY